jgi:molybdopterin molybdotransferase
MAFNFRRRKADRVAIILVLINEDGLVGEIPFHGSAHINALAFANALLEVPTDIKELNKGDSAYVRPL